MLTQVLKVGEGVVIGTLDGGRTPPSTRFLKVPYKADTPPMDWAQISQPAKEKARA